MKLVKSILRELQSIISSLFLATILTSLAAVLWYFLFGSCGYISVKSSIKDMNKIYDGWMALREASKQEVVQSNGVGSQTEKIMYGWKGFLDQLKVPACLNDAQSYLSDAIDHDINVFRGGGTRDEKISALLTNKYDYSVYENSIQLINTCVPTCNMDKDIKFLQETFGTLLEELQ